MISQTLTGLWFLVVTLCPMGNDNLCQDFIVDGDMSYQDCRKSVAEYPFSEGMYSLRCDRGEHIEKLPEDVNHG
ncbi:hypothetical protein XAP3_0072 [Xanthomonas phage XAP3]|nr:hypothetical protein XAP3_0072 [Xanthomonas phage XAP3]